MTGTGSGERQRWRGTGVYCWDLIVGLVLAAAAIVGIVQNSQQVEVKYLGWTGHASLAVVLLAAVVATVALSTVTGVGRRRSRRQRLIQRDELEQRREETPGSTAT